MTAQPLGTGSRLDVPLHREVATLAGELEKRLGLRTVEDLLRHLPRRYVRRGEPTPFDRLVVGQEVMLVAEVVSCASHAMKSRPGWITKAVVTDGRGELSLTFFSKNQAGARRWQAVLPQHTNVVVAGTVDRYQHGLQLVHPDVEPAAKIGGPEELQRYLEELVPVYPVAGRLRSWKVRDAVRLVTRTLREEHVPDPLPPEVRRRRGLVPLHEAFVLVHQPRSDEDWRRGRRRLRYEEAFVLQAALARRRHSTAGLTARAFPRRPEGLLADFDARLPFPLTGGQQEVAAELSADLAATRPMHRLLQGEVGSGKTVVALRAMLQIVDGGAQAALLAPTEVLAQQHHRSITAMLGDLAAAGMLGGAERATRVVLLTGSLGAAARRQALLDAASGAAGLVVGTHALLQERVQFADLGLVVVDEQHRFGVEQRDALRERSGTPPHLLVMTATPIPRTVAMTVFGDLEVSTLAELPPGRAPVTTHVVKAGVERWVSRTWQRVREEVDRGRRAFVVCPRIGEGEEEGLGRGAVEVLAELQRRPELDGVAVGLLHGRMRPEEKDAAMRAFATGELQVLVATTVVEVGVDVPEASVMVVVDADRFGVSQLHQLRGRVGRGGDPGLCLLLTQLDDGPAHERLQAVASTTDGFRLAEVDLEQRREGDVLGTAQSGARSSLRLLRVLRDADLIATAREDATEVVAADPSLRRHPALERALLSLEDAEAFLDRA